MNKLLTELGVPAYVQAFFDPGELRFSYGEHFEHFDAGFHRVPTTRNLWIAGKEMTREVILTSTAMEAIAFATFNHHRYPGMESLTFIAIGNLPHKEQLSWISANFPKGKYTLVFGRDLLGKLADIRIAAGLRQKTVRFIRAGSGIRIQCDGKIVELAPDNLSLSAFEKMAGVRTGIRTSKPKDFDTYLQQLKNHAKQ